MSLTNYYDIALFGKAETNLKTYGNKYIFHTYPPFSFETYYQELQNVYLTGSSESELVLIEYRTRVLTNLVTGNTSNIFVSGASVNCGNNIVTFTNTSGGTFNVDLSCLLTGGSGSNTYVTAFTYNNNTFSIFDNSGTTFNATINEVSGFTVNGLLTVSGDTHLVDVSAKTISGLTYIDFDTSSAVTPTVEGRLLWNSDDGTLDLGMQNGIVYQMGQELFYPYVVNKSGEDLVSGTLVMVDPSQPAQGNRLRVIRSVADGTYPSKLIVGVLSEDVGNNQQGFATWFGYVRNLNENTLESNGVKSSGETWNEGDILWASPTLDGGYTNVEPSEPNLKVTVAAVTQVNGVNINILVRPQLGLRLGDLHNLQTSGETNGDLLVYNGGSGIWMYSKTLPGNYTISGSVSATTYQNLPFSGTVIGSGTTDTIVKWLNSSEITDSSITDDGIDVTISPNLNVSGNTTLGGTFLLQTQQFFPHGENGFSVNENYDPSSSSTQTAYHFTSGDNARDSVVFSLARTGSFTNMFGITGSSSDNRFVIGAETSNTDFEFRTNLGIQPVNLQGGNLLAFISRNGDFKSNTVSATTYYNLPFSGTISGIGTTNYLPKWTGSTSLGDSIIYDDGSSVGINVTSLTNTLHVSASTDPVRFEGLSESANTRNLVVTSGGVITYDLSFYFSLNFIDDYTYPIILPYNWKINSVDDPSSIGYELSTTGGTYSLGANISAFTETLTVSASTSGFINLNCSRVE